MATTVKTYPVKVFKRNDYMVWHVISQCQNTGQVVLRDDTTKYFTAEKKNNSCELQHISMGSAFFKGGANLRLEVTVYNTSTQDASVDQFEITTMTGERVGNGYVVCVEDYIDKDYNDFYITLTAWKKKG
jgi:uncharacterized protein YccT (UPF0319 family)